MADAQESFADQIRQTRDKIQDSFKRSHEALRVRETSLLSRVQEIETEFNNKTKEMNELLETLDRAKSFTAENFIANELEYTREIVISSIDAKIAELLDDSDREIEFEWDPLFESDIEQLGHVKLKGLPNTSLSRTFPPQVKPVLPDYNAKLFPIAYSCKKSTHIKAPGELYSPSSIAIHYKTGRIYVAEGYNHRVQVYNSNGDYLFMFSDKMNGPRGICISLDKVLVTQSNGHCMNVYELEGELLTSIGKKGTDEGEFKSPYGLAVSDRNNNIYVCDCDNNRVQILTEDLKFHSMLGIGVLKCPCDVKATRDRVLVLDESDPCLFVFSSDHIPLKNIITRGTAKQTNYPICFDIDRKYNIIMSDLGNHCVYVFSKEGEEIHKFGKQGQGLGEFYCPYGTALDNFGRIVVVCRKDTACLQIF